MISRGFGSSLVIHYHLHPEKVEISIFIAININFLHTQLKLNCRFVEQTNSSVAFDFTACAHFQSFCLFIYFCVMQHLSNVFDILLPSEEEACRFCCCFFYVTWPRPLLLLQNGNRRKETTFPVKQTHFLKKENTFHSSALLIIIAIIRQIELGPQSCRYLGPNK